MPTTYTCANATQTEVQYWIDYASNGDTVQIPANTYDAWTSITINKAITLKGTSTAAPANPAKGAGVSTTIIGVTGASNSFVITKQAAGSVVIRDLYMETSSGGAGNKPILVEGSWTAYPVIFFNNNIATSGKTLVECTVPGGTIWSHNTLDGDHNTGPMTVKDATDSHGSWTTNSTMGSDDTTGLNNHYFEDNIVTGMSNGIFDADDGCRIVSRYNDLTHGFMNSHGRDTSAYGLRHFELYENTYSNGDQFGDTTGCNPPSYDQCRVNIPQAIWIRGGTGVVYNNDITFGPGNFGTCYVVRINARAYGQPTLSAIGKTCATIAYPEANQPGQGWLNGAQITDPIYFWGNTGSWTNAESDDFGNGWNDCSNPWSTFFQWGRDAFNPGLTGGTAKPGYTAYTYPHPYITALIAADGGSPPPAATSILLSQVCL
jgi:hypothetical protein